MCYLTREKVDGTGCNKWLTIFRLIMILTSLVLIKEEIMLTLFQCSLRDFFKLEGIPRDVLFSTDLPL